MLRLEGFRVDFAWIWGPNLDPGRVREGRFARCFTILELSWGEDGPRMPQERFQDRFWTDLGRFFKDFQWFFDALAAVSSDVLVCYIVPKVLTMSFHLAVDL